MGFLRILGYILKYGPGVISLIVEILEFIKYLKDDGHHDEAVFYEATFNNAKRHYKQTNNKELLVALRDNLRKRCTGPECPTPGPGSGPSSGPGPKAA